MSDSIVVFFEKYFPDGLGGLITFILITISAIFAIIKFAHRLLKFFFLKRNQRHLNKDLDPYYSISDIKNATRYYIPIHCQEIQPSEKSKLTSLIKRRKMIPYFINKIFKGSDDKYFIILADSGMGKTSFLINLYLKYKNKIQLPYTRDKYKILLFPLSYANILNDISIIENKRNTILLLDALDEDIGALKDYETRLNEIKDAITPFRKVIITCRTQFFSSSEDLPNRLGVWTGQGEQEFKKFYISNFQKSDVKKYLRKRYSIFQYKKKRRALRIVEKSPALVTRPMLLNYMNELVGNKKEFKFSFQIYETLTSRWLNRESKKPEISTHFQDRETAEKSLLSFTEKLSSYLFDNREEHRGDFLPKGKKIPSHLINFFTIINDNNAFREQIAKGKSLLTRDTVGNFHFAHKSIFEYFLAKEISRDLIFFNQFDFNGMDMCKKFSQEMLVDEINKVNAESTTEMVRFGLERASSKWELQTIEWNQIDSITKLRISNLDLDLIYRIPILNQIKKIEVAHIDKYPLLYDLYLLFTWESIDISNSISEIQKIISDIKPIKNSDQSARVKSKKKERKKLNAQLKTLNKITVNRKSKSSQREDLLAYLRDVEKRGGKDISNLLGRLEYLKKIESNVLENTEGLIRRAELIKIVKQTSITELSTLIKCVEKYWKYSEVELQNELSGIRELRVLNEQKEFNHEALNRIFDLKSRFEIFRFIDEKKFENWLSKYIAIERHKRRSMLDAMVLYHLRPSSEFISAMMVLESKMPKCEVIY